MKILKDEIMFILYETAVILLQIVMVGSSYEKSWVPVHNQWVPGQKHEES